MKRKRVKLRNFKQKHQYKGFPNLGNTCYMNSILQILIRNPKLNLNEYKYLFLSDKDECTALVKFYSDLIFQSESLKTDLKNILTEMNIFDSNYNPKTQNDVAVFYSDFLYYLGSSSIGVNLRSFYTGIKENKFLCNTCGGEQIDNENFVYLNIHSDWIHDYFNKMLNYDEILLNFPCIVCNYDTKHIYKQQILFFPDILALIVDNKNDINNNINMENILDISVRNNIHYHLYGMVYFNKIKSHYTSRLIINDNDLYFDDEKVFTCKNTGIYTNSLVLGLTIVMLFYFKY